MTAARTRYAGPITEARVHDHRLTKFFGQLLSDEPADCIIGTTSCVADNDLDGSIWVARLCKCTASQCRGSKCGCGAQQGTSRNHQSLLSF